MIKIKQKGNLDKFDKYLKRMQKVITPEMLKKYGEEGVKILQDVTPKDTGLTSLSWYYEIRKTKDGIRLEFLNSNIQNHIPIAVILQYGHATRNGSWVEGVDYINPALKPLFNKIALDAWEEVTR